MKSISKFRILGMALILLLIIVYFILSSLNRFDEHQLKVMFWIVASIVSIVVSGIGLYFERVNRFQEAARFIFMIALVILSYFYIV